MCHTRLPLPSPLTGRHTQPAKRRHTTFLPFQPHSSPWQRWKPQQEGKGTCRKEKGSLYCRCQHQQRPDPESRQRCCLSFNGLSVCSPSQKKGRVRSWQRRARKAGWCLPATLTRTRSMLLWKPVRVKERSAAVAACSDIFVESKLYSSNHVMHGSDRPRVSLSLCTLKVCSCLSSWLIFPLVDLFFQPPAFLESFISVRYSKTVLYRAIVFFEL